MILSECHESPAQFLYSIRILKSIYVYSDCQTCLLSFYAVSAVAEKRTSFANTHVGGFEGERESDERERERERFKVAQGRRRLS
jgi:hypothetical protein